MKFLHLSDLHIGRQLHRYSLQEEQTELLEHLLQLAAQEKPDAVLIAGDVYDKSIPPIYATQLLDRFLTSLVKVAEVFVISGNHDSAERLGFLSGPLALSGLHISPAYRGHVQPITLKDADGPVDIWLLPFVKAATVRPYFPDEEIENTHQAVSCAIRAMRIDPTRRNVLVCHQFVAGSTVSGSEESLATADISVGGSDMVGASIFTPFDYVALGHIHRAQNAGDRIRYCGTPMAYDFSEARQEKSVTVIELDGDRTLHIRTAAIPTPRRLVEVRGSFAEVTGEAAAIAADRDAYTHVILTDDAIIPDVMNRLRQVYPRITHLDWDNARMRHTEELGSTPDEGFQTPDAVFSSFYQRMTGMDMTDLQKEYIAHLIREIWEEQA